MLRRLTRGWDRSGEVSWPLHLAGVFAYDLVEQRETLPPARTDPHGFGDYVFYLPELVVRVTGFSAYFASLSPESRQLVVDRIINEC